jgi:L-histidine N-alpha-methyltransferase
MTASPPRYRTPPEVATRALRDVVLEGLRSSPKTLPAALFYDARGAALFEDITQLPEYYLTRTEHDILQRHSGDLANLVGPNAAIIEFGSGAAIKVRHLLREFRETSAYIPVDVSREQLHEVAAERALEFPDVPVLPVWADYTEPFDLPDIPDGARRIGFFPGSTIGNLHPDEASAFLRRVRDCVGDDGGLILGVDRRKDPRLLNAAYNDAAGVTAEFNLNALLHLNRELRATFSKSAFRHRAFFNDSASRIEMHLEALSPQHVLVDGESVTFAAGESVRTECSYKYDRPRLERVVADGGFRIAELFTDENQWFWVAWLEPV